MSERNVFTYNGEIRHLPYQPYVAGTHVPDDVEVVEVHPSVTKIEEYAFYGKQSLLKVTIPNTVTTIGAFAFFGCKNLKEIHIQEGQLVIQKRAFINCSSLTDLQLPIQSIEDNVFWHCTSLQNVHFPASLQHIGSGAFYYCPKLTSSTTKRITDHFNARLLPQKTDRLEQGPGPRHGFQGATQNNYGPEMWGMSLDQMKHILQHPLINESSTMRDVVRFAIKPATKNRGVGYALLVNQEKPLHADIMVSHAWDESIGDFIECLERFDHNGPFWVCAFSIYQNDGDDDKPTIGEQLGGNPTYGPFSTVLKGADSMVAVVTKKCDIYSRLWCVYELHIARTLKKEVELWPYIHSSNVRNGYLNHDVCIRNINDAVDSESAICGNDDDRRSIVKAILSSSPDGFQTINRSVEEIRLRYLLHYPIDKIDISTTFLQKIKAVELLAWSIKIVIPRVYVCDEESMPRFERYEEEPIVVFKFWLEEIQQLLKSSSKTNTTLSKNTLSLLGFDSALKSMDDNETAV